MPRIIAGEFRSRALETIRGDESTRPVLSRVKESMFGMLREWFEGAKVLDLFAGVGTIGLEAVSRGAAEVLMVEKRPRTYQVLRKNIEKLGCADRARALLGDALGPTAIAAAPRPCDLVFIDPPYALMERPDTRGAIAQQAGRCRTIMSGRSFLILRSPIGPPDADMTLPGYAGPEPHRYQKDMWVLLYEPLPQGE